MNKEHKTPEQRVNDALMASLPDIVESLKKEVKESITWQVKNDIAKHVSETVLTWYKDNMLEEIKDVLLSEKEGFISLVPPYVKSITETLQEEMLKDLKKRLENSWERSKILEAIFKG
jgi:hypothetical protein